MTPLMVGRLTRDGLRFLMAVALMVGISACAHPPHSAREPAAASGAEHEVGKELWHAGVEKFRAGDYENALVDFETLKVAARNGRYGRMGEYGAACMRMLLARSADDLREAMRLWEAWSEGGVWGDTEDPRLLGPLLRRIALLRHPLNSDADSEKADKPRKRPQYKVEWVNRDLAACRSLVQAREKEAERLKARLESREREVRRLKQQIESLEALSLIHI